MKQAMVPRENAVCRGHSQPARASVLLPCSPSADHL